MYLMVLDASQVPHTILKWIQMLYPCQLISVHLKEAFKQQIDKMLKVGVLKPVHEATPWMNSFVLVEGKDKS